MKDPKFILLSTDYLCFVSLFLIISLSMRYENTQRSFHVVISCMKQDGDHREVHEEQAEKNEEKVSLEQLLCLVWCY